MTLLASIIILVAEFPIQNDPETRNQRKPPRNMVYGVIFVESAGFAAFESRLDFDLREGKKPGNLIVRIPENVGWKKVNRLPLET